MQRQDPRVAGREAERDHLRRRDPAASRCEISDAELDVLRRGNHQDRKEADRLDRDRDRARRLSIQETRSAVLDRCAGLTPQEVTVVRDFRDVTARQVQQWRREADLDPLTGRPFRLPSDVAAHVGKSVRAIAEATGRSKSEVGRQLQRGRDGWTVRAA